MAKFCFPFLFLLLLPQIVSAADAKAIALLKGVEQVRFKVDCFQIRYVEHRVVENKTVEQIVDFDNGKIHKKHLPNEHFWGMMSVLADDVVYVKTHYDEIDINLVPIKSVHAYGADIYDPRMFGLTDFLHHEKTIRICLSYASGKDFTVEPTVLNGKKLNLVAWEGNGQRWEFYIEEPSFHVYRFILNSEYNAIQVDSEYDNPDLGPFPSKIRMVRLGGKEKKETMIDNTITVTHFERKESFPPDTFTFKSLDLPLNATVTDYRIHQGLGYWDGEKLVDKPVRISAQELRELTKAKPSFSIARMALAGVGLLIASIGLTIAFVMLKRML